MNVISFSLYGDNPKYWVGMLENLRLRPYIYPDWDIYIFADEKNAHRLVRLGVPQRTTIIVRQSRGSNHGLFWRFEPALKQDIVADYVIVRDADSRLNWREKAAVDAWMNSGLPFHIMRDHPAHTLPIMGGMWGCVPSRMPNVQESFDAWTDFEMDGDQKFLTCHVWPYVKDKCLAHDIHIEVALQRFGQHHLRPFPEHLPTQTQFVGEQCLPFV